MEIEINQTEENVLRRIHFVRGLKKMLDRDLAILYQVETKQLKRQVRRNIERFPADFLFELTQEEWDNLRCHFGTSSIETDSSAWGGTRYLPMAFTEQGIAMLSSVLSSQVAIQANIQIIRVFTDMRKLAVTNSELLLEIEKIKNKLNGQDVNIQRVFDYLKKFVQQEETKRKKVGYKN